MILNIIPYLVSILKGGLICPNFNRHYDGGIQLRTGGLGMPVKEQDPRTKKLFMESRENWGVANEHIGRAGVNYLDLSLISGLAYDFVKYLWDSSSNAFLKYGSRILDVASAFSFGKRDDVMYDLYGHGVDKNLTQEEIENQELALSSGKVNRIDDYLINAREIVFGERLNGFWGRLAQKASKVKPWVNSVAAVFGDRFRSVAETVTDFFARVYWRGRFFGQSLHANFFTTMWDLARTGFKSLFSKDARNDFSKIVEDRANKSRDYFESKIKEKEAKDPNEANRLKKVQENKSDFGLYAAMLKDRVREHWNVVFNSNYRKDALKAKIESGLIKGKIKDGEIKDSEHTETEQLLSGISDLTGPFCAAGGLLSTVIFDPLSCIWKLFGFEKGASFINFGTSLRKSFQLFNYIPRFIIPEFIEGRKYATDKQLKDLIESGKATEVTKGLYHALKERYKNAIMGLGVSVWNLMEPFLQFKRSQYESTGMGAFIFNGIQRMMDVFFLRFFSKRREVQGRITELNSLIHKKLDGKPDLVNDSDIDDIKAGNIHHAHAKYVNHKNQEDLNKEFIPTIEKLISELSGTFTGIHAWWNKLKNFISPRLQSPGFVGEGLRKAA